MILVMFDLRPVVRSNEYMKTGKNGKSDNMFPVRGKSWNLINFTKKGGKSKKFNKCGKMSGKIRECINCKNRHTQSLIM